MRWQTFIAVLLSVFAGRAQANITVCARAWPGDAISTNTLAAEIHILDSKHADVVRVYVGTVPIGAKVQLRGAKAPLVLSRTCDEPDFPPILGETYTFVSISPPVRSGGKWVIDDYVLLKRRDYFVVNNLEKMHTESLAWFERMIRDWATGEISDSDFRTAIEYAYIPINRCVSGYVEAVKDALRFLSGRISEESDRTCDKTVLRVEVSTGALQVLSALSDPRSCADSHRWPELPVWVDNPIACLMENQRLGRPLCVADPR